MPPICLGLSNLLGTKLGFHQCQRPPRTANLLICAAVRKSLLKVRIKRKKNGFIKKLKDNPRRLDIQPTDETFQRRLTSEINKVAGPKMLSKILWDWGPYLTGPQLSQALGRLAGFVVRNRLTADQVVLARAPARKALEHLQPRLAECDPLSFARAAYALGKMKVYEAAFFTELVSTCHAKLNLFDADSFSGLISGLAAVGHIPPKEWLQRFCLESYIRLSKFNAQQLAGTMYGLMQCQHRPSEPYVDSALRYFRNSYGNYCMAPSLPKMLLALAKLGVHLDFNWLAAFLGEARRKIDLMTVRELSVIMWCCAALRHSPDLIYTECWYRSTARRMSTCDSGVLVTALSSLALLGLPTVPGKFMAAAFSRSKAVMSQLDNVQLVELLWSVVSLRMKPDATWMDEFMLALEPRIRALPPASLSDLSWALARLRYQPHADTSNAITAAVSRQLDVFDLRQLGIVMWGVSRINLPVPVSWRDKFLKDAEGVYSPQQLSRLAELLGGIAAANSGDERGKQQMLVEDDPAGKQPKGGTKASGPVLIDTAEDDDMSNMESEGESEDEEEEGPSSSGRDFRDQNEERGMGRWNGTRNIAERQTVTRNSNFRTQTGGMQGGRGGLDRSQSSWDTGRGSGRHGAQSGAWGRAGARSVRREGEREASGSRSFSNQSGKQFMGRESRPDGRNDRYASSSGRSFDVQTNEWEVGRGSRVGGSAQREATSSRGVTDQSGERFMPHDSRTQSTGDGYGRNSGRSYRDNTGQRAGERGSYAETANEWRPSTGSTRESYTRTGEWQGERGNRREAGRVRDVSDNVRNFRGQSDQGEVGRGHLEATAGNIVPSPQFRRRKGMNSEGGEIGLQRASRGT